MTVVIKNDLMISSFQNKQINLKQRHSRPWTKFGPRI